MLRVLLQEEENELANELLRRREEEGCGYCQERKSREEKYEQELENERIVKCQMALEREKTAYGMKCTKADEIRLREMQKLQMKEKKNIERQEADIDEMWHQVLLEDVRVKEEMERRNADRLKKEMQDRRLAYDEQISSANRKRQEALQIEREIENRRLERMKKKMEEEYYDAIRRKNQQQMTNRNNYIEGHKMKLSRIQGEVFEDRCLDNKAITTALKELQNERQRKMVLMKSLQREKEIFIDSVSRERNVLKNLDRDSERIASSWKEARERESDERSKEKEREMLLNKLKNAEDYRNHLEEKKRESETQKNMRNEMMRSVNRIAINELENKLDSANKELQKQMEYRNNLNNQVKLNQRILTAELNGLEIKQKPFTKKAIMFKDAMKDFTNNSRQSTNPIHPFTRLIHSSKNEKNSLPVIE